MRVVKTASLLVALVGMVAAGGADADTISVNLAGSAGGTSDVAGDTGVVNVGNWNNFDNGTHTSTGAAGQNLTLVDDAGAGTAAEVSIAAVGTVNAAWENSGVFNNGDADFTALFDGRTDNPIGDLTITMTNIPYAIYDVYVYMGVTATDSHDFDLSVNAGAPIRINHMTAGSAAFSGFVEATGLNEGNYALFSGETSSTLTIVADNGQSDLRWVTGFQVVEVPEPGSLALLGLGGLMIARRRRA